MRQILLTILAIIPTTPFFAQPQAFKYQAVARDDGVLMEDTAIAIEVNILMDGVPEYTEIHNVVTNEFGLFSLNIGMGENIDGDFAAINWGDGNHTLKIKVNGNIEFPESPILAVPAALWAKSSGDWTKIGDVLYTTEKKVGVGTSDVLGTFQVVNPQETTDLIVGSSEPGDTYVRI